MRAEAVRGRAGVCSSVDFPNPMDFSGCLRVTCWACVVCQAEAVRGGAGVCSSVDFPNPLDFACCLTALLESPGCRAGADRGRLWCACGFPRKDRLALLGSAVTGE